LILVVVLFYREGEFVRARKEISKEKYIPSWHAGGALFCYKQTHFLYTHTRKKSVTFAV